MCVAQSHQKCRKSMHEVISYEWPKVKWFRAQSLNWSYSFFTVFPDTDLKQHLLIFILKYLHLRPTCKLTELQTCFNPVVHVLPINHEPVSFGCTWSLYLILINSQEVFDHGNSLRDCLFTLSGCLTSLTTSWDLAAALGDSSHGAQLQKLCNYL